MEECQPEPPSDLANLAMISKANQVAVSDSNFTLAGGHVNNISVNVALSSPAPVPVPRSQWLQWLGEWLVRPEPTQPLSLASLPPVPALPDQAASVTVSGPSAKSSFPTLAPDASDSRVSLNKSNDDQVEVVPLDRLDIHAHLGLTAGPIRMPHEIYVSHLYPRGHGYPCANPKPRGDPVTIGDIGLLEGDHFDVLENLYTLPESLFTGGDVPAPSIFCDPETFEEGMCISGGVDGCDVKTQECQTNIDEINVRCRQDEGAILVVTSPAELCEMKNQKALRKYLCEHAAPLFELLVQRHALPHGSSIYVVTGTILSATWALATYDHPMHPAHDTLVLKRVLGDEKAKSCYIWTQRGNAQTRTQGSHVGDTKNQCLFLRGFLLTVAPTAWKAWKDGPKVSVSASEIGGLDPGRKHNAGETAELSESGGSPESLQSLQGTNPLYLGSSSSTQGTADVAVHAFPAQAVIPSGYPSSRINKALLDLTDAKFAITHDDDWREAVKAAADSDEMDDGHSYDFVFERVKEVIPTHITSNKDSVFMVERVAQEQPGLPESGAASKTKISSSFIAKGRQISWQDDAQSLSSTGKGKERGAVGLDDLMSDNLIAPTPNSPLMKDSDSGYVETHEEKETYADDLPRPEAYQSSEPEWAIDSLSLPRGWNRYVHPNGDVYYHNHQLRLSTLENIRHPEILRYSLDARKDHLERCSADPNFQDIPQDLEITVTDVSENTAIIGMYSIQTGQAYEWNEHQQRVIVLPRQHYWGLIAEFPSHRPYLPHGAEQEFVTAVQQAKLTQRSGAKYSFTEEQLNQVWTRYERLRAWNNIPALGWLIGVVMPLESVGARINGVTLDMQ